MLAPPILLAPADLRETCLEVCCFAISAFKENAYSSLQFPDKILFYLLANTFNILC